MGESPSSLKDVLGKLSGPISQQPGKCSCRKITSFPRDVFLRLVSFTSCNYVPSHASSVSGTFQRNCLGDHLGQGVEERRE